jgi:signal transduction histidine kinase
MAAVTPAEVAGEILPAMARLFGGRGAAILDTALRPVEVRGLTPVDLAALDVDLPDLELPVGEVVITPHDALACRLTDGWLVVHAGPLAPVLGPAELALVERVGTFLDLALERCRLFDEEARSRRSAESANAELQTLLYSVSHDLRSPIISVLGYLDVLRQEHSGELTGDGDRYLERIEVNAVYMQNLIQDLLELSRIGRTESTPSSVDLGALARSVAQEVAATHPDVGIEVGDRLPVVSMNAVRARQLLTNLLDNAAKHAGHDAPRVPVAAEPRPDGSAVLRITDNGRGVPEAYRAKAFEVFERLDAARLGTPGTGMGLPICRRVVETLGGTIVLGGPAEGTATGTTVTIVLPPPVVEQWPTRQEHHLMEESA